MLHMYSKILRCMHSFKAMQKQGTQISRVPGCLEVRPKKDAGSC
uniref:Uncharacterized protein n=1 Tax=Arundo donax TaxID=35708 RepID=A0A0A9FKZ1_ARUDO